MPCKSVAAVRSGVVAGNGSKRRRSNRGAVKRRVRRSVASQRARASCSARHRVARVLDIALFAYRAQRHTLSTMPRSRRRYCYFCVTPIRPHESDAIFFFSPRAITDQRADVCSAYARSAATNAAQFTYGLLFRARPRRCCFSEMPMPPYVRACRHAACVEAPFAFIIEAEETLSAERLPFMPCPGADVHRLLAMLMRVMR